MIENHTPDNTASAMETSTGTLTQVDRVAALLPAKRSYILAAIAGFGIGLFALPVIRNFTETARVMYLLPLVTVAGSIAIIAIARRVAGTRTWVAQTAKYLIVGFLNTSIAFGVLNLGSLLTGVYSGRGIILLNVLSFTSAFINSFFWNRLWTFGKSTTSGAAEFGRFLTVTLGSVLLDTALVFGITTYIPHDGLSKAALENIAKVFGSGASMVWNFTWYKFFVFRK